jgi:hypothetical protein
LSLLTGVGLSASLYDGSNLLIIIIFVVIFPFKPTMNQSTCCGWLWRIDGCN